MLFETVWWAQTQLWSNQSFLYLFTLEWTKQVFVCHINFAFFAGFFFLFMMYGQSWTHLEDKVLMQERQLLNGS